MPPRSRDRLTGRLRAAVSRKIGGTFGGPEFVVDRNRPGLNRTRAEGGWPLTWGRQRGSKPMTPRQSEIYYLPDSARSPDPKPLNRAGRARGTALIDRS